MASVKKYIMKWRDFREQECILTMTDVEASGGDTVNLIPGKTPFVTNTKWDTNPMTPMRSGSGRINFIGKDGVSIVPRNSHQWRAVLTVKDMVMWTGWLKAETFNQRLWGVNEEVSLNVIDDIEALKTWTLETDKGFGMVSLRSLICECVDHVHNRVGNDMVEVMFSKDIWPGGSFDELFDLQVSRYNFFTSTEYGNEGQTCYEVLESICKTFGWTLSATHGTGAGIRLLFSYAGARDYRRVDYAHFRNGEWTGMSDASPLLQDFDGMTPMGMHDYSIEQGYKLISVVSEVNLADNTMPALQFENSDIEWVEDIAIQYYRGETLHDLPWRVRLLNPRSELVKFPRYTVTGLDEGDVEEVHVELTKSNFDSYLGIALISHDYWNGPEEDRGSTPQEGETKINYSWRESMLLYTLGHMTIPFLVSKSPGSCVFSNGGFEISLEIHLQEFLGSENMYDKIEPVPGRRIGPLKYSKAFGENDTERVAFSLRVGNMYWNGESWSQNESTFEVALEPQKAHSFANVKTNKILDMPFTSTKHVIPITEQLSGDVVLTMFGAYRLREDGTRQLASRAIIENIEFNYCTPDVETSLDEPTTSHEYKHKEEGWTENLEPVRLNIYSDKHDTANYGVLKYNSGTTVKNMYDNQTRKSQRPEEALLEKMKSHFSKTRELLTLRLRHNLNLSAQNKLAVSGKEYHILALRSVDWRTQEVELLVSD